MRKGSELYNSPNKGGERVGYWIAANCSRKAGGFPNSVIRLAGPAETWPEQCRAHKADLIAWIEEQAAPVVSKRFDGTFAGLIDQYTGHPLSTYHKVKDSTRASYDWTHKILRKAVGARLLSKITGVDFLRPSFGDGCNRLNSLRVVLTLPRTSPQQSPVSRRVFRRVLTRS